ncbi:hypothetical protein CONLIGDRAFT_680574 [Coniochaeta ligniaria NRRL 30616]|uniref:Uncharacterized protein n=1 Tax=Coniochaeta ligniaria NRRL 30616 TaxID=1408157 RepID=A0A1J7IQY5_9PEZI|nr:hypothetical protein CONLIGDRAFT_680574 [Coniochaeta ligniaria NRRL 30616]
MDIPVSADGSLSSTVEEPPGPEPVTTATDNGSRRAPDSVPSRSSSSVSDSSSSSLSSEDAFDLRNRRFPPLLPSTNRPDRPLAAPRFLVNRAPAADLSPPDSDSATDDSSEDEEVSDGEDREGGEEEDEDEDDGDGEDDEDSRVQALWIKLRDQRNAVQQLRLELSGKRKRLRELRRRKDDADNRFMGIVRPYLVVGNGLPSPGDIIIRQFEAMQKESNEYHDEEAEVEQLEAELDEEELSRETLETQFFTILYGASGDNGPREDSPSRSVTDSYAPPSRASLLGIPADRPVDIHPLYKQLLDAVGDRELAKEHHTELMMHRDSILYDLQLTIKRERLRDTEGRPDKFGALPDGDDLELLTAIADNPARLDDLQARYRNSIGQENEEFLREFPKEETMLREKLKETKDEVDRLRQLCIDKGVMRKNAPYHEEYTIFSDAGEPFSAETMSINQEQVPRREEALANTRFPILLSNPRHVLEDEFPLTPRGALRAATRLPNDDPARPHLVAEAMKEYGISTLVVESAADDKSDYINRWLLHRLRISPLEVELLYTIFSTTLKVKNTRRWQEDVLYYWSRDGANKAKEEYTGLITTRDALIIDDDLASENLNSALGRPDRPGSDPGDSPTHRGHQKPRSLQSAS